MVRKKIADYVDQIDTLQHTVKYLGTVQEIDDLRYLYLGMFRHFICLFVWYYFSDELQKAITAKDNEQCATVFANLCDISRSLLESPATNLRSYLKETLHYWHNLLKDKYTM